MAMTSAERQARFRERRDAWQDAAGFTPADTEEQTVRPRADYKQFVKELKDIVKPMPELEAEEIYAELLTRARQLREGWDRVDAEIRGIVEGEKARGRW